MKKQELTAENLRPLIGGIAEVQIFGESACGGIVGDIALREGKIVIIFAKYVEKQENGKWVRSENQSMSFSPRFAWIDGNLVICDDNTVVVAHQSLESIEKKFS